MEFFSRNCKLGCIKDSNPEAHSVDSDIFYTVIRQPVHSKTYIKLYCPKYCHITRNQPLYASTARCDKMLFSREEKLQDGDPI